MDLIKENFNFLISHIAKYNLESDNNFIYSDKINILTEKSIFFLGASLNQNKTPQNKISFSNSEYLRNNNFFDIYYALCIGKTDEYMRILRILVDFPSDDSGNKFELLNNSIVHLSKNTYINFFLNKINTTSTLVLSNLIFIKTEIKALTLKKIPVISKVSEVAIITKRK